MSIETESVSKPDLFKVIAQAASEYYKVMVTVASGFLGGSLIFMEKLSPLIPPRRSHVTLLGCGWLCLVISIFLIALVLRSNLKSGKLTIEGRISEAQKVDAHTGIESTFALIALALGIILVMLYGFVNLMRIAT
jgi:hypothetical protein